MIGKEQAKSPFLPHLNNDVVKEISGFQLCSYLVANEGWRRGLSLKWYKDESEECKLSRLNSSTHGKFFSLQSSKSKHYFFRSRGDKVENEAVRICQNKEKTKALLRKKDVPVPVGKEFTITSENEMLHYAKEIGYPIVIKPVSGSMGKGVFTNIKDENDLKATLEHFRTQYRYKKCLLEKYYEGREYRFYVVGNNVISIINRIPANVIGNGTSTIETLISEKNKQRKLNPYLAIKPIKIDYEVEKMLSRQGLNKNSVPKEGETIYLRELSNLSAGGDPIDATNKITPEIKLIAVNALKALPAIPHAGVDIIVDKNCDKKGVVLEINATAEIGFHSFPLQGEPKDVPAAIIDYYFPETIGHEKSQFYFDYKSILEPLKTWSAKILEMIEAPRGELFGIKYTVSGKVVNVNYMNWIRRQALTRGLHGYVKKACVNKLEVIVISTNSQTVRDFIKQCKKGSKKSKVDNVISKQININDDDSIKIGFEIRSN